jgi:hypothetical protein
LGDGDGRSSTPRARLQRRLRDRAPGRGNVRDELFPAVLRVPGRALGFALRPAVGGAGRRLGVGSEAVPVRWGCCRRGRRPGRSYARRAPIWARLPRRRGLSVVTHLDRLAASDRRPARRRDDPRRALIGGRLLAGGREYRRSGHWNHPGREQTDASTRTRCAGASNRGMAPASDAKTMVRPRRYLPERPDELERRLQERLDALGPAPRAELLHVLMLPDLERAARIGEFWGYPESRGKLRHGTSSADTGDK